MCVWQKRVLGTMITKPGLIKTTKTDSNIRSSKSGEHGSEFLRASKMAETLNINKEKTRNIPIKRKKE
jgi:hypothetical protein